MRRGRLRNRFQRLVVAVLLGAPLLAGCGGNKADIDTYDPVIDPAGFTVDVDNPWFPLAPGMRWIYEGTGEEGRQRVVIEVTSENREVMGVETVVVRETTTLDGELAEETYDWFAQDAEGSVWYFGEDTKEIEDGRVTTEGSWEAGVGDAKPGIVMKAEPRVGDRYRQEHDPGVAEDMAEVLSVTERVTVPVGTFEGVVKTRDFTPLEPEVAEEKLYARDVGLVRAAEVEGGSERVELVEMTKP